MALLDNVFKQRMVGALVLIALAVIFLPMLFTRQDESHPVQVDAPAAPQAPAGQQVQVEPVTVPEPQALPQEPVPDEDNVAASNQPPSMPIAPAPAAQAPAAAAPQAVKPAPAPKPTPAPAAPVTTPAAPAVAKAAPSGVDANGLSVSWSVQLASMSNRANADNLQKTLRTQGYNAYIRTADGVNRVFVGPLIERAEADRLRDQLDKQQKLKGIVVRFQPEKG
ncbi:MULTISPECIES: SPOR domain-containing protein [Pseudomonas syringae group]|uniref:Sporulation related protein n=1 Tax=Pseudomonas syringae pv. primulae TaxID=251707 RepID=A0A0Q0D194_9PSED|nr:MULTISPECIES: SPOR domain-containing protein [Pseudomonas syringae group]KPY32989.1 Sporulation related protein [Pseudomonas syringae pv. primulae]MBD8188850.1 SPOR domain-containing protein [Pseudomonas viridiflava]MBD8203849.1 SPOR domain-containing protein [Pseudomonas viridiflava]MDY0937629.1 SPOR domain-containing protein [Pseudomonas viridiflava]MDY1014829.1 SPOR domain-containing protein [Pseudomonas viridiflava]